MDNKAAGGPDWAATPLEKELDELSLTQALRDFEVANARVIDLTTRLLEANTKVAALTAEVESQRTSFHELEARHEAMRGSIAFRLASKIWAIRNALRA